MERCMEPKLKYTFTEKQAQEFALKVCQNVVVRRYKDGNSSDTSQPATQEQANTVFSVVAGSLVAIGNGHCVDGALNAAEYIFNCSPHSRVGSDRVNSFDSIYLPIQKFLEAFTKG